MSPNMFKRFLTTSVFGFILILLCSGFFETASGLNQKGNKEYEKKHYDTALDAYRKAQVRKPDQTEIRYNLGTALYQVDQFEEAQTQLEQALANAKTKDLKGNAWYNFGNTEYRLGQFDKSIDAYKKALELNPDDKDAKYNLELLQKKKGMFDIKQKEREKQNKKNQSQSQNQQQKQNQGGGGSQSQQSQGQGQEQKQNQSQENKDQNQSQGSQGKEDQNQNETQESQGAQGNEEEKEKNEQKENQKKGEEGQNEPKNQGTEPLTGAQMEKQENQAGNDEKQNKPLYQGQMSKENALRILEALKDSEQELQVLRRPTHPKNDEREPEKDW